MAVGTRVGSVQVFRASTNPGKTQQSKLEQAYSLKINVHLSSASGSLQEHVHEEVCISQQHTFSSFPDSSHAFIACIMHMFCAVRLRCCFSNVGVKKHTVFCEYGVSERKQLIKGGEHPLEQVEPGHPMKHRMQ